jgi:hypothetical protein
MLMEVMQRRKVRPAIMALVVLSYLVPWLALGGVAYGGFDFDAFMIAHRAQAAQAVAVPPISWHLVRLAPFGAALVVVLEWRAIALRLADLVYYVVLFIAPFAVLMAYLEAGSAVRILAGSAAPFAVAVAGVLAGRCGKSAPARGE